MLIFHKFKSRRKAEAYADAVTAKYKRWTNVYDTQEESNEVDPFPFLLRPPIVLVDRLGVDDDLETELEIEQFVKDYGGKFAGT
jgi:hypothetical protein